MFGFDASVIILACLSLIAILLAVTLAAMMCVAGGPLMAVFGFVPLVVPVLIVVIAAAKRRMRQAQLLWLIATAIKRQVPLPDEVAMFAETLHGRSRRQAGELAAVLAQGTPLPEAFARFPDLVPATTVPAARVGTDTASLADVMRDVAVRHTTGSQSSMTTPSATFFTVYLWALITLVFGIALFLVIFVVPKLVHIFDEFDMELNGVTRSFVGVSGFIANYSILFLPLIVLPTVILVVVLVGHYRGWQNVRSNWLTRRFPRVDTPWLLRYLAWLVRKQRSLGDGLAAMAGVHHREHIQHHLQAASDAVQAGRDCWTVLEAEDLLSPRERRVLEAAERVGNLPWALNGLADSIEERQRVTLLYWFEFMRPVVVIILGLAVAFICTGIFLPLIQLIGGLS